MSGMRDRVLRKLRRPSGVAAMVSATAMVLAVALMAPGHTVLTKYPNDLFVFLDGAHRVLHGQSPNIDFHSALGPVVYLIPALGLALTGSAGAAMPIGIGAFLIVSTPMIAHILASRTPPSLALPFAGFALLVMAAPMHLGESVTSLSFAMFYNRLGWALLAVLLVMHLEPLRASRQQTVCDASSAALITLLLLYMKASYGLVAIAFIGLQLFAPRKRPWAAGALLTIAGIALFVEALWRGTGGYISDVAMAARIDGGVRGGISGIADFALRHLADLTLLSLLIFLASWRSPRLIDLTFYCLAICAGFLIISQNAQPWGILSLHGAAVVAAALALRAARTEGSAALKPGAAFLFIAMAAPTITSAATSLTLHIIAPATTAGREALPGEPRLFRATFWFADDEALTAQYMRSIADAVALTRRCSGARARIAVLDFSNPISILTGSAPTSGDSTWQHWNRNISEAHHWPAEQVFAQADLVLDPKWGINAVQLRSIYGAYIHATYEAIAETELWTLRVKRGAGAVLRADCGNQPGKQGLAAR